MNEHPSNSTADACKNEQRVESAFSIRELAREFGVSTKTISRWRKKGLIARQVVRDGRSQLEFASGDVDRFAADHPELIRRGRQFSHMTDQQRAAIIQQARQLALARRSRAEIVKQLAKDMGRNSVTIREVIRRHDQANPQQAVFPRAGALSADRSASATRFRLESCLRRLSRHRR